MKGGGDDDDDDDDVTRCGKDDRKKNVREMMSWNPPVINFKSSSYPKIKFCRETNIESCDLVAVRYSGVGDWQNISDFAQTCYAFVIKKRKRKGIYFQVS